jgi:hypothetical protein
MADPWSGGATNHTFERFSEHSFCSPCFSARVEPRVPHLSRLYWHEHTVNQSSIIQRTRHAHGCFWSPGYFSLGRTILSDGNDRRSAYGLILTYRSETASSSVVAELHSSLKWSQLHHSLRYDVWMPMWRRTAGPVLLYRVDPTEASVGILIEHGPRLRSTDRMYSSRLSRSCEVPLHHTGTLQRMAANCQCGLGLSHLIGACVRDVRSITGSL